MMFLLASCGKIKQTTTMSGKVIDYATIEPIENVRIYVRDGFTGSGPILDNDDIGDNEALTYTDKNGEFDVSIKAENNPVLYPSKSSEYWNYNEGGLVNSGEIYHRGDDYEDILISLKALAYLKFRAENTKGIKDSIMWRGYNSYPNLDFRTSRVANSFELTDYLVIGNSHYTYEFSYKKNGKWESILDSIYIPLGETRGGDTIYY